MELKHDKTADAIYIKLSNKPYAYGKDLDDLRRIDYDADGNVRGVELLCVSEGVNLDGLPLSGEIAKTLGDHGIQFYVMASYLVYLVDGGVVLNIDLAYLETVGRALPSLKEREEVTV